MPSSITLAPSDSVTLAVGSAPLCSMVAVALSLESLSYSASRLFSAVCLPSSAASALSISSSSDALREASSSCRALSRGYSAAAFTVLLFTMASRQIKLKRAVVTRVEREASEYT